MRRPAARPAASSQPSENTRSGTAFRPVRAAKDSAVSSPVRISRSQLDLISTRLTDIDRGVLHFLSDLRLATGQQLARRLWQAGSGSEPKARAARRALGRLEGWRLIQRLPQRIGGVRGGASSIVYGLAPAGRRLLSRDGRNISRLDTPGDRYVRHTLAITELAVRLHEATIQGRLDLIELQPEPQCWRIFVGGYGARRILKPDLFVRIGVGAYEDRWFLEVDQATESVPTVTSKATAYLEHFRSGSEQRSAGVYPRVIWTVPDHRRAEQIAQALLRLPLVAGRLFLISPYEEVIGRLSAEASS